MVNVRTLHGVLAIALTVSYTVWMIIANAYSADSGVYSVKFTPGTSEDVSPSARYLLSSNNISALGIQMIGSITTLLFIYYADYVTSRSAATVAFWSATLFAFSWLASHAYFMADGFYERPDTFKASTYSKLCTSSFTSLNVAYSRTTDALTAECNALRGGAAMSVITGIIQGVMVAYAAVQVMTGKLGSEAPRSTTLLVAHAALAFAFVGQLLRAAGALRIAQQYRRTEDRGLFGSKSFQFFSSNIDYQSPAALAIQMQTLGTIVAFAFILHATAADAERPAAPAPALNPKASGILGFLVALVIAFYTTTATIWDGRAIKEGPSPICGDNPKCDAYKAGFAGEVILAFGAWVLVVAALVALKQSRAAKDTNDRSLLHGLLVLGVSLVLIVLVVAFFISNFIAAVTYYSNDIFDLNAGGASLPYGGVHNVFLVAALWAVFMIGAYVYWYYSKSSAAAYAAFYGGALIAAGWLVSQYYVTRLLGTNGESGSPHSTNCPGKDESFSATDDKICRLTVAPGVITLLFGIGEAGIAGLLLLGAVYAMIGGGSTSTSDAGATNFQQKLLFLVSFAVSGGFIIWNISMFGALPKNITSNLITLIGVYGSSFFVILAVLTILSVFGAMFVATTKDVAARARALPFSFLTTGAAVILGWAALPAASYSLDHVISSSIGACVADKGADVCSAARTGVAGLYIYIIANTVSLALQALLSFTTDAGAAPAPAATTPAK